MYNGINWLPKIIEENDYATETGIDYIALIEQVYTYFVMDFCNSTSPVMFEGKKVVICKKQLDCSLLKKKECYNSDFYTCQNCNFQNKFDIFNHISTDDYYTLHKKDSSIEVPKLKVKKRNRKIPRTPGRFNIERLKRIVWIKSIIENCADTENVLIFKNSYKQKSLSNRAESSVNILANVTFILKNEKYKVAIEPIRDKQSNAIKYFVLNTAFYMN